MLKFSEMFQFKKDPDKSFENNLKENKEEFEALSESEQNEVIKRDQKEAERIESTRNTRWSNEGEYKVDPESSEAKGKIRESQELYEAFAKEFLEKLDLSKQETIHVAYEKAKQLGLMEKAQEMREYFFGKDMHFYGVAYTCDYCNNNCAYCPFAAMKRENIEGKPAYPYRALNEKQVLRETKAVMKQGHTHICYLEGSPADEVIQNGSYAKKISKFVTEIITGTKNDGLEEIVLNIEPLTEEGFKMIAQAAKEANEKSGTNVALQFRVFQETYNKDLYERKHDQDPSMPKRDYQRRIESQARALKAGFDNVGLGALFNLNDHPIEEINGLMDHVKKLREDFGKGPVRICLPSANELANFKVDIGNKLEAGEKRIPGGGLEEFKYGPYEEFDELLYVLARLAMPDINIVSSERDTPAMLRILDKYATCTTLGVETHTGGNSDIPKEEMANAGALKKYETWEEEHKEQKAIEQATTFPRKVEPTLRQMISDGWNPILRGKTELIEELKIEKVRADLQK